MLEPMKSCPSSATTLPELDRPGEEKERKLRRVNCVTSCRVQVGKAARESEPRGGDHSQAGALQDEPRAEDQGNPNKVRQQPNNNNQDKSSSSKVKAEEFAVAGKEIVRQKSEVLKASPAPAVQAQVTKDKARKVERPGRRQDYRQKAG